MTRLFLSLAAALTALTSSAQITGTWKGDLDMSGRKLPLTFHFKVKGSTLDSPAQNAFGMPLNTVTNTDDAIAVEMPMMQLRFEGTKQPDGSIAGTFKQGPVSLPLTLTAEGAAPAATASGAHQEEVAIQSAPGITLGGTLVLPANPAPGKPAVVFLSGSGAQNRDEELFGKKPFALIADSLAAHGIASLRCDDRGVAESTGSLNDATLEDLAGDARAMLAWLKARPEIGCAGIIGHSQGALTALELAASKDADFIIGLGAPALPGSEILVEQNRIYLGQNYIPEELINRYCDALAKLFALDMSKYNSESAAAAVTTGWSDSDQEKTLRDNLAGVFLQLKQTPILRTMVDCDPTPWLKGISCPSLLLWGELDTQVIAKPNEAKVNQDAPAVKTRVYPGLNHLMEHATTGAVSEYPSIKEVIAPEVVGDIVTFILAN